VRDTQKVHESSQTSPATQDLNSISTMPNFSCHAGYDLHNCYAKLLLPCGIILYKGRKSRNYFSGHWKCLNLQNIKFRNKSEYSVTHMSNPTLVKLDMHLINYKSHSITIYCNENLVMTTKTFTYTSFSD
jgi:hypothetical protein